METKVKKFKRVVPEDVKIEDLTILNIVCGTTKCSEGFHCFSQKKSSLRKFHSERACKECGAELIDWERIHKNNLNDVEFTFESLTSEIIRHVFFHTAIEKKAIIDSYTKGKINLRDHVKKLLRTRIGKHNSFMDGRQTPMGKDEITNYAQHATATCCRKCLEAWHNIKLDAVLSENQINFCTDLVMKYVEFRIPDLNDEPISLEEAGKKYRDEDN
jgi:hypothetical protein